MSTLDQMRQLQASARLGITEDERRELARIYSDLEHDQRTESHAYKANPSFHDE
jgi:hypothetical protein